MSAVFHELEVEDWGQLHIAILWVYRGNISPGSDGWHSTSHLTAWLILSGEAKVADADGRIAKARAGEWLFVRPGRKRQEFAPDTKLLSIRWRLEWPDGTPLFDEGLPRSLPAREHPGLRRRLETLERIVSRRSRRTYRDRRFAAQRLSLPVYLEVEQALLGWIRDVCAALAGVGIEPRLRRFEDPRLARALRVLDAWPLHEPFSDRLLFQKMGLGRSQFESLFTRTMGQTAKQYLDRRRFRYAEHSLQVEEKPVKEIAFEVGFRHVSSFSAWFARRAGRTPTAVREQPRV